MDDDTNSKLPEPIGLPTYDELEQESLTDVAQRFRFQELTTTKWILFGVGCFSIVIYCGLFAFARPMLEASFEKQLAEIQAKGQQIDPARIDEMKETALRSTRTMSGVMVGLGIVFCVLGLLVPKFPVYATVAGLVLFICVHGMLELVGLSAIFNGFLIKILIFISLASAIKTAMAYERQVERARANEGSA